MPRSGRKYNPHPVFWLAVSLACGILVGRFAEIARWQAAIVGLVLAVGAAAFRSSVARSLLLCGAFFTAGAGLYNGELAQQNAPDRLRVLYDSGTLLSRSPVDVEGVLKSAPEESLDGVFVTLGVDRMIFDNNIRAVSGNVRVFVPAPAESSSDLGSEISNLGYGSRVRVTCALEREDEYLNPGVQTRRDLLDRTGIDATCTAAPTLVEQLADGSRLNPLGWVYNQRARLIDAFRENLSPRASGVMIASLLGNKYFLDKDTADLYREGGTFHILVISGLHITFIGGLLLLFVRLFTRNRWLQFTAVTTVLWLYTLAVGADTPVVRASVMFTIFLLGYAMYRQASLLNSLGICAVVLLVWKPSSLFDPSFQLTFVSVGAIVGFAYPLLEKLRLIGSWSPTPEHPFPPIAPRWLVRLAEMLYWNTAAWRIEQKRNVWTAHITKSPLLGGKIRDLTQKLVRWLFEGLLVSAIVQLWMLPLSVWYFHRVAFSGVLLNIWVGFWIAIESFAAVIGIVLSNVSSLLGNGFFAIADAANWILLLVPTAFSDNGWTSFRLPAYHGAASWIYVVYYLPLVTLAVLLTLWDPFKLRVQKSVTSLTTFTRLTRLQLYSVAASVAAFILIAVVVAHPFSAPRADGRLHIDYLDVGQGDSIFVTFPNGETLLVDGGGKPNYGESSEAFRPDARTIGEAVVSQVLWYKGYSHVDHILATHSDADHIQGLNDVARNFTVGDAIFGRTPMRNENFASLADILTRHRVPVEVMSRGDAFDIGGAHVEVLNPTATDDVDAPYDNNHCLVLRIAYGSRSFLLTGDIERQTEADMLLNNAILDSDIVKVPHHGSRTSSTPAFVAATHPQYAVISVGRHSTFGHPHPDVVQRWQDAGVRVMTTGENGMVSASTNGQDIQISRYVPE